MVLIRIDLVVKWVECVRRENVNWGVLWYLFSVNVKWKNCVYEVRESGCVRWFLNVGF